VESGGEETIDEEERRKRAAAIKAIGETPHSASLRRDPLVYIQYMRFARRCQGVDAARKVFLLAKKAKAVSYHSYIAAALVGSASVHVTFIGVLCFSALCARKSDAQYATSHTTVGIPLQRRRQGGGQDFLARL
jgi:hypothetical protein